MTIRSFTLTSFLGLLSVPVLNPSNTLSKTEFAFQESLRRSLDELSNLGFMDAKSNESRIHRWGKPVRAMARILAGGGVALVIAPLGVLFHASKLVHHSITWLQTEGRQQLDELQKIKDCAAACFKDLTFFGCAVFMGWSIFHVAVLPGVSSLALFVLSLVPFFPLSAPADFFPSYFAEDERVAVAKTMLLHQQFGVVEPGGRVMRYNKTQDDEDAQLNGLLGRLWKATNKNALEALTQFQKSLPKNLRVKSLPYGKGVLRTIDEKIDEVEQTAGARGLRWTSTHTERLGDYKTSLSRIPQIREMFIGCLVYRKINFFQALAVGVLGIVSPKLIPRMINIDPETADPFSNEELQEAFAQDAEAERLDDAPKPDSDSWSQFIEQAAGKLPTDRVAKEDSAYETFRSNVIARKSPLELFGFSLFENPEQSEIAQKLRILKLALHPDRNRDRHDEATELFSCLARAQKELGC